MGRKSQASPNVPVSFTVPTTLQRITTGSIVLDSALKGGVPRGAITLIAGRADTGKTLICSHIVANAVKQGHRALILDFEGRFLDPERLINRGLTEEQIKEKVKVVTSIYTVEDASKLIRGELTASEPPAVIVIDSIGAIQALTTLKSVSEEGKSGIGDTARAITREFKDILYGLIQQTNTALIMTTQKRTSILPYGAYESDYLPNILRHAPAVYLQLKTEDEGDAITPLKSVTVRNMTRDLFKKIIFNFEKNQTGYPHARGVSRYYLFTRPDYGIRIGDWDLIFEICGLGSASFFGVVRRTTKDNQVFYITPTGNTYLLPDLYTKPSVREKFLSETFDIFYQKMLQFWEGNYVTISFNGTEVE